ncbi:MAG: hypothetical protein LBC41_16360 [Clostridiales bacterium]|nr:hypothetical protein [Clostridiales bacterium]
MLTKVNMWNNEHGWQHSTADQAVLKFPRGLSSNFKIFLCEICGQYVNFVNAQHQLPYFRHNSFSDDCKEKMVSSGSYKHTNPLGFSLPLKAKLVDDSIEIFIGFLPLTDEVLEMAQKKNAKLKILADRKELKTFNIGPERFMTDKITYLSVDQSFAEKYVLEYDMEGNLNFWPTVVEGFSRNGTLFNKESGKRLARNANVVVGNEYLLFIPQDDYISPITDVMIEKIKTVDGYNVYSLQALSLSREAADYFLNFGLRLTDTMADLTQVYPFVLKSTHVLLHASEKVWFYKSEGFVDACPSPDEFTKMLNANMASTFSIRNNFTQILSISRFEENTSVLNYIMLKKAKDIPIETKDPEVSVTDSIGEDLSPGEYGFLPKESIIRIRTEYDGQIITIKDGFITNRRPLKNNQPASLTVEWETVYQILQGFDVAYEVKFTRKVKVYKRDDEAVRTLKRLRGREIIITHSLGAVARKLQDMPKTREWLLQQIKRGKISQGAVNYLRQLE